MDIGNFFVLRGITDPENDTLQVTAIMGRALKTADPMTAAGLTTPLIVTPSDGFSQSARIRTFANGDMVLEPNDLSNAPPEQVYWLEQRVYFTDGNNPEQSEIIRVPVRREANQAPIDPNPGQPVNAPEIVLPF